MLVLAPKLPGEECVISVSVGENEQNKVQFDELFDYIIQTNVSTIAGGMKGRKLSSAWPSKPPRAARMWSRPASDRPDDVPTPV